MIGLTSNFKVGERKLGSLTHGPRPSNDILLLTQNDWIKLKFQSSLVWKLEYLWSLTYERPHPSNIWEYFYDRWCPNVLTLRTNEESGKSPVAHSVVAQI